MNKNLIGIILILIGFIIVFATLSLNTIYVLADATGLQICYLLVVIGGIFMMLGVYILAERFKGWARR